MDAFCHFMSDEDVDKYLRRPTNRRAAIEKSAEEHAALLDDWLDVSMAEMYGFLAIIIFMGVVRLPADRDYWSHGICGQAFVRDVMARDRFLAIKHCFSVANPTYFLCEIFKPVMTR